MSQQEFERQRPRPDEEIYQPQYPYSWSNQAEQEGMPRDEPPINSDQADYQSGAPGQGQVPWWARPQRQQNGSLTLAGLIVLLVLVSLLMGGLGIVGVVLGSLAHLFGIIIGAILMLLLFVFLFVLILLSIIGHALGRAFGPSWMYDRRAWRNYRRTNRRAWHEYRRMNRRAWRRFGRDW